MAREVELADEAAARAVVSRISAAGESLKAWVMAPEVEWGDDKFGDAMRESYYETMEGGDSSLPVAAFMMKHSIGDALIDLGDSLDGAITELVEQEQENLAGIDGVTPPSS